MDKKIKKQWVKALRSGEYRQGAYALGRLSADGVYIESFCCLGVLAHECDPTPWVRDRELVAVDPAGPFTLSPKFLEAAGLSREVIGQLAFLNDDGGKTFDEIADWIEENL
jgi:hypothetical protein